MPSYVPAKKNTAFIFYCCLIDQTDTKLYKASPTLATGDATVSIDGGTAANLATLPTVTPSGGKSVKVSLSASEMNGDNIQVVLSDVSGAQWCDHVERIQTSLQQIDDVATPAQVNAQVLDVLNVDTFAEPGQTAPAATTTLVAKIGYLYKFLRNKKTQTATTLSVFADDGTTVDQKATISDDGTTYTHGEIASGP